MNEIHQIVAASGANESANWHVNKVNTIVLND